MQNLITREERKGVLKNKIWIFVTKLLTILLESLRKDVHQCGK